jgi:transcriptional repressor NrdR
MKCPVCGEKSTRVIDSRLVSDGMQVRRRRECENIKCLFRFSTAEVMEVLDLIIVKRDGRRELYSRKKLSDGLSRALQKRPYKEIEFSAMIQKIERDLQKRKVGEIRSEDLGNVVMEHLRKFDKVAYIRFASVYYSFEDLEKFEEELNKLSKRK